MDLHSGNTAIAKSGIQGSDTHNHFSAVAPEIKDLRWEVNLKEAIYNRMTNSRRIPCDLELIHKEIVK